MKIVPEFKMKSLRECEAGELVRAIDFNSDGAHCLVAEVKSKPVKALISISGRAIEYKIVPDDKDMLVLSYGPSCELHIPQDSSLEIRPNRMYEGNGCIIRNVRGCFMNVRGDRGYDHCTLGHYDIESGELRETDRDINGIAVFGKWCIYLCTEDMDPSEKMLIAAFEWQDPHEKSA